MIVVDTGVLLAAADAGDADHATCAALFARASGPAKGPRPGQAQFLRLITTGQIEVIDLRLADYGRCAELVEAYASLRLGLVDASVVTFAENLNVATVATLNHRDFTVVGSRRRQRDRAVAVTVGVRDPCASEPAAVGPTWQRLARIGRSEGVPT
jgi:predicted nucleic acid-binding protein